MAHPLSRTCHSLLTPRIYLVPRNLTLGATRQPLESPEDTQTTEEEEVGSQEHVVIIPIQEVIPQEQKVSPNSDITTENKAEQENNTHQDGGVQNQEEEQKGVVNEEAKEEKNKSKTAKEQNGKEKKRGRKKRNIEGYQRYVYGVLKQVHPEMGISSKCMTALNNLMNDMFERLTFEVSKLTDYTGHMTLSSREIQGVVRLVLPGELEKHAIAEGVKAVNNYTSYDA
ncbi:Histone H2B [Glycine soja]|nr:hypothetical protein JHK86_031363 [Glycine max]